MAKSPRHAYLGLACLFSLDRREQAERRWPLRAYISPHLPRITGRLLQLAIDNTTPFTIHPHNTSLTMPAPLDPKQVHQMIQESFDSEPITPNLAHSSAGQGVLPLLQVPVSYRAPSPADRRVGAAILCADGTVIGGCNVENASYGGCRRPSGPARLSRQAPGSVPSGPPSPRPL